MCHQEEEEEEANILPITQTIGVATAYSFYTVVSLLTWNWM